MGNFTYYDILEVSPSASPEVIEAAYKRLARKYHPDVGGTNEQMALLNEAFETLSNPLSRQAYNEQVAAGYAETIPEQDINQIFDDLDATPEDVFTPRPWARFVAKMIDYWLLTYIVDIASYQLGFYEFYSLHMVWRTILINAIFAVTESVFITSFATTPGKMIMGIKLKNLDGSKLLPLQSLFRSVLSMLFGLGLGLPIIYLFTTLSSYSRLKEHSFTYWDAKMQVVVIQKKPSIIKWFIGWLLFLGLMVSYRYLSMY